MFLCTLYMEASRKCHEFGSECVDDQERFFFRECFLINATDLTDAPFGVDIELELGRIMNHNEELMAFFAGSVRFILDCREFRRQLLIGLAKN